MIVAPAVDLKGGRCVQLVGGEPDEERVSLPDPVSVARSWSEKGFEVLHVVDLDAALGHGENGEVIDDILRERRMEVQVGGGVRSEERIEQLLDAGVARVVIGTRALDEPAWLADVADRYPGRLMIALDTREGLVLRKGWTEATELRAERYLPELADLPLAGVLSTDVGREGRLSGIDRDGCRRVIEASPHPAWISGGITTLEELAFLAAAGAHGVVLGMAVYTGALDTVTLAERWGSNETEPTA
ncbi:MAG: 1-(5-phosphoribosyl)-5-[(5-phosphoribosylamino)methylideneamino] imidazole-4-carboxamide isomerase [Longimicrobiales bacterium]|nr:1-(5-phosphoribosyl)-5-[(5-phosphoribosylamino)methylideneamino] imidazole-4-carboxamide isomerase [Longimicrobiales bacterium]